MVNHHESGYCPTSWPDSWSACNGSLARAMLAYRKHRTDWRHFWLTKRQRCIAVQSVSWLLSHLLPAWEWEKEKQEKVHHRCFSFILCTRPLELSLVCWLLRLKNVADRFEILRCQMPRLTYFFMSQEWFFFLTPVSAISGTWNIGIHFFKYVFPDGFHFSSELAWTTPQKP